MKELRYLCFCLCFSLAFINGLKTAHLKIGQHLRI